MTLGRPSQPRHSGATSFLVLVALVVAALGGFAEDAQKWKARARPATFLLDGHAIAGELARAGIGLWPGGEGMIDEGFWRQLRP